VEAGVPSLYDGVTGSPLVGAGAFRLPGGSTQIFEDVPQSPIPWMPKPTISSYPYLLAPLPPNYTPAQGTELPYIRPPYGPVNAPFTAIPRYAFARPGFGPYSNPGQPGFDPVAGQFAVPQSYQYPRNQFFDFVSAQIRGSSAKVLADPTLIVQESESSSVGVGRTYTTKVQSTATSTGVVSCDQDKETAGLEIDVSVARIDDNGFVTLKVNPTLSIPAGLPSTTSCNGVNYSIYDLAIRELKTGEFRVRDGQTLILTGVIQDDVKEEFSKWPVLGDLPLIGQLFRKTANTREKRELVVVVTPKVINDAQGGGYGYGYEPTTQEAKKLIYQP